MPPAAYVLPRRHGMPPGEPSQPADDPAPNGGPLVPLLRVDEALADPDALATWHAALSSAVAPDVPHQLLALWLYPWDGGAVLLGPEALSQDHLDVPVPAPQVSSAEVAILEATVRRAGYGSVAAVPVRSGRRDVGLLLAADLPPGRYGDRVTLNLELVAERLSPMLGRLARQWGTGAGSGQTARIAALVDVVAFALPEADTPQGFVADLSRALEPLLPHDRLELLLAEREGNRVYRFGEHAGGPLWSDPSLEVAREHLDLEAIFGSESRVLIPDTYAEARWPRGYFTAEQPAGAELRAVIGARLDGADGLRAYLLAGSASAELYDEDDAALLERVAGLIAAKVVLLVESAMPEPLAPPPPEVPGALQVAELLATGSDFAETLRRVGDLAARFLPFDSIQFALRLNEGDRVVLLTPGERRPLPDLPLVPVGGTTLASVLQGEIPHSFVVVNGEARLIVPLRVAGRVHGALVLTAEHPAILRVVHIEPAQQLADVAAAHLELLRRTALLPPPYLPGWKRIR